MSSYGAIITRGYYSVVLIIGCITDEKYVNWMLRLASVHGQKAPLPFIKSVEVILR